MPRKQRVGVVTPDTAKTLQDIIRHRHDGPAETMPYQESKVGNNRVALVQAVSLRTLPSSTSFSGTLPSPTLWLANVLLYDALQSPTVVGHVYLYDPEDRLVADKVYLAIESAPDEIDGTPIFVTSTAADDILSPVSLSSGSGSNVEVVTDVHCDGGGLSVTSGTLTGIVYILGKPFPVVFTIQGGGSGG